jgi:hypothetical protein
VLRAIHPSNPYQKPAWTASLLKNGHLQKQQSASPVYGPFVQNASHNAVDRNRPRVSLFPCETHRTPESNDVAARRQKIVPLRRHTARMSTQMQGKEAQSCRSVIEESATKAGICRSGKGGIIGRTIAKLPVSELNILLLLRDVEILVIVVGYKVLLLGIRTYARVRLVVGTLDGKVYTAVAAVFRRLFPFP